MKLIDILKLMYEENYNVNIKLKEFCKNGEGHLPDYNKGKIIVIN